MPWHWLILIVGFGFFAIGMGYAIWKGPTDDE
jgi:hypothetical protein